MANLAKLLAKIQFSFLKKHASLHSSKRFIYNGIDFQEYPHPQKEVRNWKNFLFLAKASWKVKNLQHCIDVCKESKKHLFIAGGRKITFSSFIHSQGMLDQESKVQLLQKMDALLFPVRWHEPFGLAIVEAFSAGLPVLGSPYGSLPELISDGMGQICKDFAELKNALLNPPKFNSPKEIRALAEERFSSYQMAKNYLKVYEEILDGGVINTMPPLYSPHITADTPLAY